ncbi:hypothetical protein [Streptomyces sp. NPDC014006]|uniref:hypothetical protein n=1 Tax=Streptomyces sp. NPDC014006 TaxID=3364870 RepID=UPI0037013A76
MRSGTHRVAILVHDGAKLPVSATGADVASSIGLRIAPEGERDGEGCATRAETG